MLEGLIRSSYQVTGTWPMRSELSTRNVGRDTNALASSVVLVCRLKSEEAPLATRREFLNALKRELLAEQEGEYDADTRWALAWFEQYGVGEGVFGDAETLSKSLGQLGDKRAKRPLRRQLKVEQEASVKRALKDALHQIDPKAKERPPLAAKMSLLGQRLP